MFNLQREDFPSIDFETIVVSVAYPGALPSDVENNLAIPIEREIRGVDGVKDIISTSIKNLLTIRLKVEPGFKTSVVADDVKKSLDQISDYPIDAEKPVITEIDSKRRGVISVAVYGESYEELQNQIKNYRNFIEEEPYISKVNLSGYRDYNYIININPKKLQKYEVSLTEVRRAIFNRNLKIGGGTLIEDGKEVNIRINGEISSVEKIRDLVIRSNYSQKGISIGQIAEVKRDFLENEPFERINGKAGLVASMVLKENADIIESITSIKMKTDSYMRSNNLNYLYIDDLSYYVERRLGVLTENAILGFFLVVISLIAFLNFKTAIFASLGAPISFFGAFILMDIFGISLNLISMFGLILVLGMLVDDAIVLAEKYYQFLEKGLDKESAALKAVKDTIGPITSTILTTMIAFSSMFFMGGIMGKFLWTVPVVVIFCLLMSWLECFFILPNHLADFGELSKKENLIKKYLDKLKIKYEKVLRFFLKHSFVTIILFLMSFILSLFLATSMRFELFPGDDIRVVTLQIEESKGTPVSKMIDNVRKLEEDIYRVLKREEYISVRSWIGKKVTRDKVDIGDNLASIKIEFTDFNQRKRTVGDILVEIQKYIDLYKFKVSLEKVKGGPPVGKDVDIKISGYDRKKYIIMQKK